MNIDRLLRLHASIDDDRDTLGMIISNHIDYYLGDKIGVAAVSSKNWDVLIEDIIKFMEFKKEID